MLCARHALANSRWPSARSVSAGEEGGRLLQGDWHGHRPGARSLPQLAWVEVCLGSCQDCSIGALAPTSFPRKEDPGVTSRI